MNKLLIVISIVVLFLSVSVVGFAQERPTRTYYNNKVAYKALFNQHDTNLINVQVRTKRGKVQVNIPVVNDAEKDLTQKKGK